MLIQELGRTVRERRKSLGLTQEELAHQAGLSRNTLNRLESGLFPDLGLKKVGTLLERLGMEIDFKPKATKPSEPDYVGMAAKSASVSFTEELAPAELVNALLSGKAPQDKEAHFIVLLEEASPTLFAGLMNKVGSFAKPGKVEKNLQKLAKQVGLIGEDEVWKKAA